jgi:uncharacterized protein YcbK (DUF882 family)
MHTIEELNPHNYPTTPEIDANLKILFDRIMKLQEAIGFDLKINSGLRSEEQQQGLISDGKSKATHSKHITGQAADIDSMDGILYQFVHENINVFEEIGLWMEDFKSTPTWIHVQIVPPGSGKRIFIP